MKSEAETIKSWVANHDVYATIDRNPTGQDKLIMAKGNYWISENLHGQAVTEKLLDEMLIKFDGG